MKTILLSMLLAPSLVSSQVIPKVERDEMTGNTNAYAIWLSDSLDGHLGRFQVALMFRCRNDKLDAVLNSVGNPPAEGQNQNTVQRMFERHSRGEITIKVKVDTASRIEQFEASLQDNFVVFRTGVWPGVIDLTKDVAKRVLRGQDYLLMRYVTIWGVEVTPKFALGPLDSRISALTRVFDTCGKKLL